MPHDSGDPSYVSRVSARGRTWSVPRVSRADVPQAIEQAARKVVGDVSTHLATIMANRDLADVEEYLSPSFRGSMPDPYALKGMREAVERVVAAFGSGEKIALYGDYDVDGATSTAIMVRHFRMLGQGETLFYIPDRMTEGYGPNSGAMETLAGQGVNLLIILDSGITAFEPIARAVELGMEVIVIDHHKAEAKLPEATVINPKRLDEDGSLQYLCTAGLAFLFAVGLQRKLREDGYFGERPEPDLRSLLGIVALGTVADMVPLVGLNRAYVKLGLPQMDRVPGIRALRENNDLGDDPYTVYTCGFVYGPCINAGGRIGDTMNGARLLSTDDPAEANRIAEHLCELNRERRAMQQSMVDQALERVTDEEKARGMAIIHDDTWHPGIVGLVASRIKEALDISAIVVGTGGKGSARAADGFDIGQAIIDARLEGILIAGGGHAAAGGLTVDPARLDDLRAFMLARTEGLERPPLGVDLVVPCGALSVAEVRALDVMEPFGLGNPSPRIAVTGGILQSVRVLKGKHLKGVMAGSHGQMDFILFNAMDSILGQEIMASQGHRIDLYGKVKVNSFGGKTSIQMHPEDAVNHPSLKEGACNRVLC